MQDILNQTNLEVTSFLGFFAFFLLLPEKKKSEELEKMELLIYFKKPEYYIWHLCQFLRFLLSLIRQCSHISLWGIRWPFCACSFPIKNATPVAARVSFGSWEAGDLPRCKSAAVAEPRSHQVHGHCVCCVLQRAPKLAPFLGPLRVTYTPLRSVLLPFTDWPPWGELHVRKSYALIDYFCCVWIYSERVKKM